MTTRSAVLFAWVLSPTRDIVMFECPANTTTIVKSFWWSRTDATAEYIIYLVRPTIGVVYIADTRGTPDAPLNAHLDVWFVMEPQDQLAGAITSGTMPIWCSGALLPLRPQ